MMAMDSSVTDAELEAYMDAAAAALGLRIEPEWRDSVRASLTVVFRLGGLVWEFELPDEAEPASVFAA
jgi:hypothetical protein